MLKERQAVFSRIHKVWDIALTVVSFIAAYFIKKYLLPEPFIGLSSEPNYYILLLLSMMIWYLVFEFWSLYKPYRERSFGQIAVEVFKAVFTCFLLLLLSLFVLKVQEISRIFLFTFFTLNLFLLISSKYVIYRLLSSIRKKGFNFRNILVVGGEDRCRELLASIKKRPEAGYKVIGRLATEIFEIKDDENDLPMVGSVTEIEKVLMNNVVDILVIADPIRKISNADEYIYKAENMGVSVHIMPEWGLQQIEFKPRIGELRFENTFGEPSICLTTPQANDPRIYMKSFVDYLISGIVVLLCAVPFTLIAAAIKLSSEGPVFFRQERVGLNGRKFVLYKFRTMIDGAEQLRDELADLNESDGPVFKIKKDPRIIPWVGTFLRKTSLDELPQLINVLKGEMSLVGPRPPLPEEIKEYGAQERRRLSMKPGITCTWQTSCQRHQLSFKEWVNMDLKYIDNWSPGLDFRILMKTVLVVLRGGGR